MSLSIVKKVLWVFVILGLVCCILTGFLRWSIERNNKTVELACDYDEIYEYSQEYGYELGEMLEDLRLNGINSIAINEETLRNLSASGEVLLFNSSEMKFFASKYMVTPAANKGYTYIVIENPKLYEDMLLWLKIKLGGERIITGFKTGYSAGRHYRLIAVDIRKKNLLRNIGLGFSRQRIRNITGKGLKVILRPANDPYVSTLSIENIFNSIEDVREISGVIFSGTEVLGYPDYVQDAKKQFESNDIKVGVVEFTKQKGIGDFSNNIVRVHSVRKNELKGKTAGSLIYRFKRAVVERNARLLYIRFTNVQARNRTMGEWVAGIRRAIEGAGFKSGIAGIMKKFNPMTFIPVILISLGLIASLALMIKAYTNMGIEKLAVLMAVFVLMAVALGNNVVFVQILALIIAVVFPSFAVKRVFDENSELSLNMYIKKDVPEMLVVLRVFFLVTLFSAAAALFITGLLSRWDFMMKVHQFRGIKLALLLPLLAGLLILYPRGKYLRSFMSRTVKTADAAAVLAAAAVLFVFLARSGNNATGMTGELESVIRDFLERILYVRPRFKEFLVGHPLMLMGIYLWVKHLRGKGYMTPVNNYKPFIIIGMVAQVSIINTFCHIHTPIMVSVVRTLNGLWLGILLGMALISLKKLLKW